MMLFHGQLNKVTYHLQKNLGFVVKPFGKLLIYTKNNKGPRIEPRIDKDFAIESNCSVTVQ